MMRRNTAFYISTLFLLLLFMVILAILTGVFSQARQKSIEAQQLTAATELAKNAAEAVSAARDQAGLLTLLTQNSNTNIDQTGICAAYDKDLQPSAEGFYRVYITYEPEARPGGTLVNSIVTVKTAGAAEALCSLSTAVYIRGERAG